MYQLIASDLDETLLNRSHQVTQKNIEAIKKADELGVKFVLATGRGYMTVQDTLKEIGLHNKADEYVISFNGGGVTENLENHILRLEGISFELANALFNQGKKYDVCIHVYTQDQVYVYNLVPSERNHLTGFIDFIELKNDQIDFLSDTQIIKVLFMNPDREYLQQIADDLNELTQNCDVSYSSNRYLEFNQSGINKGSGLLFLTNHLGIDIAETIAIGDNFNDQPMLETAGLSIGVQNMVPALKEKVDYITKATCEEDAMAEVIERFILS